MARACTICTHSERDLIDQALLERETYRSISRRFAVSPDALGRHKKEHVPTQLAKAVAARESVEVAHAGSLYEQVQELRQKALELLAKAEMAGDFRTALSGVREARACVELLMEVEGELNRNGTVSVTVSPQWVEVRTVIMSALQAHPEARQAAASALKSIEGGKAS